MGAIVYQRSRFTQFFCFVLFCFADITGERVFLCNNSFRTAAAFFGEWSNRILKQCAPKTGSQFYQWEGFDSFRTAAPFWGWGKYLMKEFGWFVPPPKRDCSLKGRG